MKALIERLEHEVLVCDGAMGTQLIEKGMPNQECPDYWGIKNPKILADIHSAYIDAGADMIITNTFGANRIKLQKFKLEKELKRINTEAVKIAKKAAAGSNAYVLADIGPVGEYLEPVGKLKSDDCYNAFLAQAKILEAEGVNAIIIETMTDIEELKVAIKVIKENIKIPLITTMSFGKTAQGGYRTTSGITVPQMVDMAKADVIGSNCGVDIAQMVDIITQMRPLSITPIIAQPNAGAPQLVNNRTVYKQTPDEFAEYIPQLIKAGANIVGGCCGTTPEHIRKIKKCVKS